MSNYFYNFYNKAFGSDLFYRNNEDGTPSPPESVQMITEDGISMITEDGNIMITE